MRTPSWWQHNGPPALALTPLGWLYGLGTAMRLHAGRPWTAPIPVVCVGNITAGGTGKTPVTLDILERLPGAHALLRGYGGTLKGPVRVDTDRHTCIETGDEALLLAGKAPTWVSRNRASGARAACTNGAQYIVMDDGLQNPSLTQSLSLVVIDGNVGFGNGRIIPAGPLREKPSRAWKRAHAAVLLGEDQTGIASAIPAHLPILRGRLAPGPEAIEFREQNVIAFAGIGQPQKFFGTLVSLGARLVATYPFADHHPYTADEINKILEHARATNARVITTTKDAVRLDPAQRHAVSVLTVRIQWDDHGTALDTLLESLAR